MHQQGDIRIEIVCGALVGLGVIALVQMLSLNSLDIPLKISLYCFAISIPSLAAVFLSIKGKGEITVDTPHRLLTSLWTIGNLTSLFGISGLFFHFAIYAGIIFIAVSLIGIVAWARH